MDENIHDNKREFLVDYYNVDINNHKNKINQVKEISSKRTTNKNSTKVNQNSDRDEPDYFNNKNANKKDLVENYSKKSINDENEKNLNDFSIDNTFDKLNNNEDNLHNKNQINEEKDKKKNLSFKKIQYTNKISTSKYTWLNCIPKIIYEQFKKLANFYFLIIAILQVIKEISISDGKPVILVPLMFVVIVNGIKDFLEDYKRKKSDDEENNKICYVFDDSEQKFLQRKWSEIKLGDIIKVNKNEYFPADLVLINTSEKNGECYIETKNLDGETNLKFKQAHSTIRSLFPEEKSLINFSGLLKTKKPNQHIYEFDGVIKFDNKKTKSNKYIFSFKESNNINISNISNSNNNNIIEESKDVYHNDNKKDNSLLNYIVEENNLKTYSYDFNMNKDITFCKNSTLKLSEDEIIVDKSSFLLRGCSLRNAEYIIGLCVYNGHNTKIMKNSPNAKHKTSKLDVLMNRQIFIILLFQMFLSAIACIIYYFWIKSQNKNICYIFFSKIDFNMYIFIKRFGGWILIFTNLVPISLLVTLEMIKYVQGMYICWDIDIYDQDKCIPALVQTSTLNEELGQVKFIFSDKTGTLTKNYMEFQEMSIGNTRYGKPQPGKIFQDEYGNITNFNLTDKNLEKILSDKNNNEYELIFNYFICLSVCHSIIVEKKNNNINYHSSSPDETAFINCARNFGFIYLEKDCENNIYLKIRGENFKIKILNVIEYTCERKMMSVIVQFPNRKIMLYAKGADSTITSKILNNMNYLKATEKFLLYFARKGLRTLMIAKKEISEKEYFEWNLNFREVILKNEKTKDEKINKLYNEIETNLSILGSTAINDELQDDLEETLNYFISTGIKVWVLTGDKFDTAKSIAFSSKLITHYFKLFEFQNTLNELDLKYQLETCLLNYFEFQNSKRDFYDIYIKKTGKKPSLNNDGNSMINQTICKQDKEIFEKLNFNSGTNLNKNADVFNKLIDENIDINEEKKKFEDTKFAIIISAEEIEIIMKNKVLQDLFYKLCIRCSSVVCCRVSPKQKAEMVNLIKSRQSHSTILAIGDGANDVNMICTANIGVGILGVEGRQAARASDYSISKFSFLKKLLFVHGREAYRKNSFVVCYNFYKNVLFVLPQFWFGLSSGFSGQPLYDPWIYQLYNIIFSCLPIIWFGIYDKEEKHRQLMKDHKLYYAGMIGKLFHSTRFWKWILYGALQGYIIYIFCYIGNDIICDNNGRIADLYTQGALSYFSVVVIVNFKILYATTSHTIYSILLVFISVVSYVLSYYYISTLKNSPIFNSFEINMKDLNSYFITVILMIICLVLDYGVNKLLEIFGYLINAKKIDMQKYELNEQDKEEESNKSHKNMNNTIDMYFPNESSSDFNSKHDTTLFTRITKKFNNLCNIVKSNFLLLGFKI